MLGNQLNPFKGDAKISFGVPTVFLLLHLTSIIVFLCFNETHQRQKVSMHENGGRWQHMCRWQRQCRQQESSSGVNRMKLNPGQVCSLLDRSPQKVKQQKEHVVTFLLTLPKAYRFQSNIDFCLPPLIINACHFRSNYKTIAVRRHKELRLIHHNYEHLSCRC